MLFNSLNLARALESAECLTVAPRSPPWQGEVSKDYPGLVCAELCYKYFELLSKIQEVRLLLDSQLLEERFHCLLHKSRKMFAGGGQKVSQAMCTSQSWFCESHFCVTVPARISHRTRIHVRNKPREIPRLAMHAAFLMRAGANRIFSIDLNLHVRQTSILLT